MRIDHLELINFKKYKHLKADFGPGVNLLVGVNGAGKTSVLEGLCVAVGVFFKSRESQKVQRYIDISEIRLEAGARVGTAEVIASSPQIEGGAWKRMYVLKTRSNRTENTDNFALLGEAVYTSFEFSEANLVEPIIAPLIAYYPTQRLFKDASKSPKQRYDSKMGRANGYLEALSGKSIKQEITQWWGNAATRRATFQIKEIESTDQVLENVEAAIQIALKQLGFAELDFIVYQEPDWENELFIQLEQNNPLPLAYYSDGFRNLLFLIVDLVWRASQLNPTLTLEEISSGVNGVVMIDEIDLHLHPKWQAEAIPILQKLFPNVQFFITTHSPMVIASFSEGQLYTLEGNDDEVIVRELQYGKLIDEVQEQILQAPIRQPSVQDKIEKLFKLIEQDKSKDEYEPLLDELKKQIGPGDEDVQRAESMISWNTYEAEQADAVPEEER